MKRIMILSQSKEKEPLIKGTIYKLNNFLTEKNYQTKVFICNKKTNALLFLYYFLKFYYEYLRFSPDIIITFHPISFIPCFFKKFGLIKKPVIYYWWDFYTEAMGRNWPIEIVAYLEFFSLKNATKTFTNSKFQKELAEKAGIDAKYFELGVEKYFNRNNVKKINLPGKNKLKILYYGDLTLYKGIDKLMNSVKKLPCDLIILGEIKKEFLKYSEQSNVYFRGYKDHKEMPSYINSVNLVAIPATQDGTLKMFETLRMGKAIIGFKGRLGYFLEHKKNAYLVEDLGEGIRTLIKNPNMINEMEKNNQKVIVSDINDKFEEHIKELEKLT